MFKRLDVIIIVAIMALALSSLAVSAVVRNMGSDKAAYAEIYIDGELERAVSLDEEADFTVEAGGGYNRVVVEDGSVRIADADCGAKVCVHCGRQSIPGSMIACLPHRLVIKVTGDSEKEEESVDAIAY
ncbi:MAG: NusG domain II-containing protein [Clostridiales Family XIII bacterium]|jgi:hypothetical protein|nr:NusG domain II-containing protein [Clostridiales Family XIII bacterium]